MIGRRGIPAVLALTLLAGCGEAGSEPELDTIPTDTFVDTYVALRIATLSTPTGELSEAQRDSVLAAHNVRPSELLQFAEVHGPNATFMQAVWDSVEVRYGVRRDELSRPPGEAETPPN